MKQLFSFFIISILLIAFAVQKNTPVELTQLVVTIPELNSSALQKNLELEFENLGGVKICKTSLMTKTLPPQILMRFQGVQIFLGIKHGAAHDAPRAGLVYIHFLQKNMQTSNYETGTKR